ncbi:MAG TPA: nuclear transport factor 2 family protein [Myxococcota bacterium]
MRGLALLALALLASPESADAHDDPAAAVEAYYAALAAGDVAAAEALLAPDAMVLESGQLESRAEYLAHHLAADVEFARSVAQTRSGVRVVIAGDSAWVTARARAQGQFRGRAISSEGAELIVLSRDAHGWRIRAIHWSSRAREPEPTEPAAPNR